MTEQADRQRVDKWLFFSRIVKSRSLAAKLAVSGKVRVNRNKIDQASHPIRVGDVLTVTLERRIVVCKVLQPGVRRGPASEARELYEDLSPILPSKPERKPKTVGPVREPGSGRPTKKERREMDKRIPK